MSTPRIEKRGDRWHINYEVVSGIYRNLTSREAWVITCNGKRIDIPYTEAERMQQDAGPDYKRYEWKDGVRV